MVNLLDKYLKGELTESQVEEWANALECREDVGLLPEKQIEIQEVIFQLANPSLNKPITPDLAKSLKMQLSQ